MSEIKIGRATYRDTQNKIKKKDEKGITCCGGPVRFAGHIDAEDYYETFFDCECGNAISVLVERDEEDRWW